jgi:hypothetical protein
MNVFRRLAEYQPGGYSVGLGLIGVAISGGCFGVLVVAGVEPSDALQWLAIASAAVVLPYLALLWALGRFGPGNRAELKFVVPVSVGEALAVAELELGRLRGVRIVRRDRDEMVLVGETRMSFRSEGEFVEVSCRALPGQGGSELTITSTPRVPVWSDLGKCRGNVRTLERRIEEHVASTARSRESLERG